MSSVIITRKSYPMVDVVPRTENAVGIVDSGGTRNIFILRNYLLGAGDTTVVRLKLGASASLITFADSLINPNTSASYDSGIVNAGNEKDFDDNTYAERSGSGGSFGADVYPATFDLGAVYNLLVLAVMSNPSSTGTAYNVIQISSDGTNWTWLFSIQGTSGVKYFAGYNVSARYIRWYLSIWQNSSLTARLHSIEAYNLGDVKESVSYTAPGTYEFSPNQSLYPNSRMTLVVRSQQPISYYVGRISAFDVKVDKYEIIEG